ncbi:aryl hydrocarbon receptor 2 [Tachysurus fulvidraco]|uniref:aryl hydrocarbon receptor 2 n=1 Tax=Tachysurus fulvidraco TaxID=1234273 RepID=UPI001FEFFE69|nr:aryl hydrocarbon receptor 2 [Tachysurus fulvidraco]
MKKTVGGANSWPTGTLGGNGQKVSSLDGVTFSEGELLLQALNGFVLVITADGYVFYASPTIQDYLGFHQSDVVHQSVFELIHTDDRALFRRQLHFALKPTQGELADDADGFQKNSDITTTTATTTATTTIVNYNPQQLPPENSSFLERSFCCRFRCLLDNSSGFLALNFHGRLKYLHGQNKMAEDGTMAHPQLSLFVIATPLQPPSILEIRSKTLLFQTKHKLDFTPMGIDTRGKVVLGYNEIELCMRGSGYQFIHAADMMYCADNHLRMIKTGESGFTVFRLLTKTGTWVWVQANARLVYKGGRPDFIVARQRALTNEEGEEHLRQRKLQLPFSFATGEAVLYETTPSPDMTNISTQIKGGKISKPAILPPSSLLSSMLKQDETVYQPNNDPTSQFCLEKAFRDSHALLNVPGKPWAGAERGTVGIKEESTVQEMMGSLQQIIGDSSMCGNLEELSIDREELKEWENALLRMNNLSTSELSVEINDILTNDIFSYVEDVLFKECSNNMQDQLPECLSELQLQGDLNDLLGISEGLDTGSPGRGIMNHAHIGPEMPLGQQVNPGEPYVELCESMIVDPSLSGQQNQSSQSHIQSGNLGYPETVTLPKIQNQAQHVGFHNHNSIPFGQAVQPRGRWAGPQADRSENFLLSQNVMSNHVPSACLKGQFPLSNQSSDNQRLATWQPSLQQVQPTLPKVPDIPKAPSVQNIPNGHHHVQQIPLNRLMLQSNFGSGANPQPNTVYDQQGELVHPSNAVYGQQEAMSTVVYNHQGELLSREAPAPVSSCMFERPVQAPVNGMCYSAAGQDAAIPSCQKTKAFVDSVQGSYVFQNQPAETIYNNVGEPSDRVVVCHLHQQFLGCNNQTQITNCPVKENKSFQFTPVMGGTPCFTNTAQNDSF